MSDVPVPTEDTPTIIDQDKDPIEVLRMMARFISDNRGIAKIVVQGESNEHESLLIGYAVLCKKPEKSAIPIYECSTRKVEHMKLADWLLARGHEVSAAEWRQLYSIYRLEPDSVRWGLFIKRPAVPELPDEANFGSGLAGGSGFHRAQEIVNIPYGWRNIENGVVRRR